MSAFVAGRVVNRREVLHGAPWMEHPVTVVSDEHGLLAVLLQPGSTFIFHEHSFGEHPWAGHRCWTGTTVLQLQRDGDSYGVWKFFDADGAFLHWYINFEAPIVRHVDADGGGCYDTDDHGLDIVVSSDGTWEWKDIEDPAAMVASGRITAAQGTAIHGAAAGVARLLDADDRWWSAWDDWTPSHTA